MRRHLLAATALLFLSSNAHATNEIIGTTRADTISGTFVADAIHARAGNDTIRGLGGSDVIFDGAGSDQSWGGSGSDVIMSAGPGVDTAFGEADSDHFFCADSLGRVAWYGNAGNDVFDFSRCGPGSRAWGGEGADTFRLTPSQGVNPSAWIADLAPSSGDRVVIVK